MNLIAFKPFGQQPVSQTIIMLRCLLAKQGVLPHCLPCDVIPAGFQVWQPNTPIEGAMFRLADAARIASHVAGRRYFHNR